MSETPTSHDKVGIVYSTNKKHIRRHIYVHHPAEWAQMEATLGPGETLTYVPMAAHHAGHEVFHQAIADAVGLKDPKQIQADPVCAVIDAQNRVVNLVMADDEIDKIDGHTLVNSQEARLGHLFDPITRTFKAP